MNSLEELYIKPLEKEVSDTNRDNLVEQDKQSFNLRSGRNLRIFKQGKIVIPSPGGLANTVYVNHDLGFPPTYLAFGQFNGFWYNIPYFVPDGISNPRIIANVTDTTLDFASVNLGSVSVPIYYFIFREEA